MSRAAPTRRGPDVRAALGWTAVGGIVTEAARRQFAADNRSFDERLKAAGSNLRFQDRRVADLETPIAESATK